MSCSLRFKPSRDRLTLDTLVQAHVGACYAADGFPTSTHAGVAAVLGLVAARAKELAGGAALFDPTFTLLAELEDAARP